MSSKFEFFWSTMELCDWSYEGDDDSVLKPVIKYLSKQSDEIIFKFDDLMSELLYNLDTKKLADQCQKIDIYMSDDSFLYSRCVALINGAEYYEEVKKGKQKGVWELEFEALIYVPQKAWELKHNVSADSYPYVTKFSFETGSNNEKWK